MVRGLQLLLNSDLRGDKKHDCLLTIDLQLGIFC